MSAPTLRFLIAAALSFHAIGHLMGVIPALGLIKTDASSPGWLQGWTSHSWLLSKVLGEGTARVVCAGLFLVATILTLAAVLGLLGWGVPYDNWRTLATIAAVVSLITIVLYWNALIFFIPHKVGALSIDIAVLVCLFVLNWPTEAAIGY